MNLAKQGKILLDTDEVATSNHVTIDSHPLGSMRKQSYSKISPFLTLDLTMYLTSIQFGSFEPIEVEMQKKIRPNFITKNEEQSIENDMGWTLVTRKKSKKHCGIFQKADSASTKEYRKCPSQH